MSMVDILNKILNLFRLREIKIGWTWKCGGKKDGKT